jgi:hypothetical protein
MAQATFAVVVSHHTRFGPGFCTQAKTASDPLARKPSWENNSPLNALPLPFYQLNYTHQAAGKPLLRSDGTDRFLA